MDPILTKDHFQIKSNIPTLKAGDRVRVHQKIKEGAKERVQVFEGLIIKTQHGTGINGSFTVRRISLGVGSEKTFPLHLPTIVKIEKLKSAKVRRAKLFYVRDLVGKKARRLKREKDDKDVWEIVGGNDNLKADASVKKDPEQVEIEESEEGVKATPEEKLEKEASEASETKNTEEAEAPEKAEVEAK